MDDLHIQKVLNGNVHAFNYFLQEYKDMAYTLAVSVVKDEFVAQEVVQDAFLKAYEGLKNFNRQSMFRTWFYRIVINQALKRLKKQKKEMLVYTDTPEHGEAVIDDSALLQLQSDERMHLINTALQQLPPKESLVLRLFYLEEQSIKMVQELTGWSVANIKVLLFRARKNMLLVCNELIKKREI